MRNKAQEVRKSFSPQDYIERIEDMFGKEAMTPFQKLTLAIEWARLDQDRLDGDCRDEHAFFRTKALWALRDAVAKDLDLGDCDDDAAKDLSSRFWDGP
jgi:hypothetical protein